MAAMEFTGKHRNLYRVSVVLERIEQIEHETEGWVPMPTSKPEVLNLTVIDENTEQSGAAAIYNRIALHNT